MIQSGDTIHTNPFLKTISKDGVNEIKQAAFLILEQTGCRVDHPGILETLTQSGAVVNGTQVYLPRNMVQSAIEQAPK
jgi:trimethylamine:corrinoid methyltransferase-like protein